MSRIVTQDTQTLLWQKLIRDAQSELVSELGEELESYLVFTLMRHAQDGDLAHRVMSLSYLESLAAKGMVKQEGLRDVGDQCLLIAGLFPERAKRRMVPVSYFVNLGRGAYRDLSEAVRAGMALLYRELAEGFTSLVEVLLAVRRLSGSVPPCSVADLARGSTQHWSPPGQAH